MTILPHSPGVYKITCIPTNKAYIGSTTDLRKRRYWHWGDLRANRHHNRYLQNAWNKYGADAFTFEVLECIMFVEYLHEREQYWLDYYNASNPKYGFNTGKAAKAPWLGRAHSEETKQKLSELAAERGNIDHARVYANEWHGSDAGLNWHREHGKRTWIGRQPITKVCAQCGATYQTLITRTNARFCSAQCKERARSSRKR